MHSNYLPAVAVGSKQIHPISKFQPDLSNHLGKALSCLLLLTPTEEPQTESYVGAGFAILSPGVRLQVMGLGLGEVTGGTEGQVWDF